MQAYRGPDRRKHPRLVINFVVSYRVKEIPDNCDLSQTKNVSQGGMLLTTNRRFHPGTQLAMSIRFPFVSQRINLTGEVVDSREVVRDLIYETRLRFIGVDEEFFKKLGDFIQKHLK
ncbi:MAG: PilZ domain-containing protein [Candidatus Omnitrophota bacterium]|nr:MAG: PilZ domain-containing protein [Candidatus Omnitrophota bacterium]